MQVGDGGKRRLDDHDNQALEWVKMSNKSRFKVNPKKMRIEVTASIKDTLVGTKQRMNEL